MEPELCLVAETQAQNAAVVDVEHLSGSLVAFFGCPGCMRAHHAQQDATASVVAEKVIIPQRHDHSHLQCACPEQVLSIHRKIRIGRLNELSTGFEHRIENHVLPKRIVCAKFETHRPVDRTEILGNDMGIAAVIEGVDQMVDRFGARIVDIVPKSDLKLRSRKLGTKIANA